jgi:hypothetical protein
MPNTTKGYPYPSGTDNVDVPGDIQALADAVDASPGVTSYTSTQIAGLSAGAKWAGRVVYNSTTGRVQVSNGSTFSDVDTTTLGSSNPQALGTAAAGVSTSASREDHVHAMPSAANVGAPSTSRQITAGNGLTGGGDLSADRTIAANFSSSAAALGTSAAGSANSVSRGDHVHAMPTAADVGAIATTALTATAPAALSSSAAAGSSTSVARLDHVHPFPTAANVGAISTAALTSTAPANLASTASAGSSSDVARRDHVHALPTAADVGAVANALVTAKGDLIVATGNATPARLAVGGTNGHALKINSATATGLEWGAVTTTGEDDQIVLAVQVFG